MEIFISNISSKLTPFELRKLFNSALDSYKGSNNLLFWRKKEEPQVKIRLIEKHSEFGVFNYGLVAVTPSSYAQHCVSKLNNQFVDGRPLIAREYIQRSYMNERRSINWRDKPWHGVERRVRERRLHAQTSMRAS